MKTLYFIYRTDTEQWLVNDWVDDFANAWGSFDRIRKGVISTRRKDAESFIKDIISEYCSRFGRYGQNPFPKKYLKIIDVNVREPVI